MASKQSDLEHAAFLLKNRKIVAMPTETVYGLAAHGYATDAIERVFVAKNRPHNNPLILHVSCAERARELFDFSECIFEHRFRALAHAFWPGPLTIVAKKASHVPLRATGNLPRVAVRVPRNDKTRAVMEQLDFPLVMPSANLSTRPSPTTANHVLKTLDGRIDAVLDDGTCSVGIESTVVLIDDATVRILRPGMITPSQLEACLSEPVAQHVQNQSNAPESPGQAYLHYSPKVSSVTCASIHDQVPWNDAVTILARAHDFDIITKRQGLRGDSALSIVLSDDAEQYAHELYAALYRCEQFPEKPLVIILPDATDEVWHAIVDRIGRSMTSSRCL